MWKEYSPSLLEDSYLEAKFDIVHKVGGIDICEDGTRMLLKNWEPIAFFYKTMSTSSIGKSEKNWKCSYCNFDVKVTYRSDSDDFSFGSHREIGTSEWK